MDIAEDVDEVKEDGEEDGLTPAEWAKHWQREKDAYDKRVRRYSKQGVQIVRRFLDVRRDGGDDIVYGQAAGSVDMPQRLNLFHTNVSTLQSMLFAQLPKIDIDREHADPDDDIARVAATLFQRILETDVRPSGDDLTSVLHAVLQDRLLPGMGLARVRYKAVMGVVEENVTAISEDVEMEMTEREVLESERALIEYVHWQDFSWGWARTWKDVPWIGYRSWLTKEEAEERFGEKIAKKLTYKRQTADGGNNKDSTSQPDMADNIKKAEIWEYWYKEDKRVYWFSEGCEYILDIVDDPLGLRAFWPSPKPLIANETTSLLMPKADFTISQDLYNEIDLLQSRIATITDAVKVIGVYDKNASDSVGRMFQEALENEMIPVDNWAMFAEKGGLQGTIDWFPTKEVVEVLQTLIAIRDQTIDLLYQVTGMSDLMRGGNTDQYTSDGTNQLKAKMGSVRVQALQDEFARFASDLESLKTEVIAKHYETESIIKQSNALFMPDADKPMVMPAIELMKSPDSIWRVDIRPESVAMVDYAQLKNERTEFLTAMATYVQSAQAAVKQIPGSLPLLLELMKWGMAGFKGSDYLEGIMDQAIEMAIKAPPKEEDDPKAAAQKAQQEQLQMQMQVAQQNFQNDMQKIQAKSQADAAVAQEKSRASMEQEAQKHQGNMKEEMLAHQNNMKEMEGEMMRTIETTLEAMKADVERERAQSTYAAGEEELEHENNMLEIQEAARVNNDGE